jgi:hypothetical protein
MATQVIISIAFLLTLKQMREKTAFRFGVTHLIKFLFEIHSFAGLQNEDSARIPSHSRVELVDERETHYLKLFGEKRTGPKQLQ